MNRCYIMLYSSATCVPFNVPIIIVYVIDIFDPTKENYNNIINVYRFIFPGVYAKSFFFFADRI